MAELSGTALANVQRGDQMRYRTSGRRTGIGLTRGMRFDNFIVGPSNASAFNTARVITTHPRESDNPLVICGEPGTGKTHLLNAIGNAAVGLASEPLVHYLSAGSFSRELAEAEERGTVVEYLDSLADADVLLMDDLHLIRDRKHAHTRFLPLAERLIKNGAQVILSWCYHNPSEVPPVGPWKPLFHAAAIRHLWPADERTKKKIVQKELADTGLSVPARMISLLALADTGDIRELKGIVRNIVARAHLCGESVSQAMVEGVLAKLAQKQSRTSREP